MSFTPHLLIADDTGSIVDDSSLRMVCDRGGILFSPSMVDLVPLPPESELFLLPGRRAIGFNPRTGKMETRNGLTVAAFAAPGYTLDAHAAYNENENAPVLPLFAYGAVGYARGRMWICARKVDNDPRQRFDGISRQRIEKNCRRLLRDYPHNRLVGHIINNCVRRYACPAARNFSLGRYEAPLPTSRVCNARCVGCISQIQEDSRLTSTPQCRLEFVPTASEIVEVMRIHEQRETRRPIFSFGQGCEGDPLLNAPLLAESIRKYREAGGNGTVNCNTNGSIPENVKLLAQSGLTSMRVSMASARPELYAAYHRPEGYCFAEVAESVKIARQHGVFVSLNLLYFPGITDTLAELEALSAFVRTNGVCMIQWRNLNIDPQRYLAFMRNAGICLDQSMGLKTFMGNLKKLCPWLVYGYFNPFLGAKASIDAPMPQ